MIQAQGHTGSNQNCTFSRASGCAVTLAGNRRSRPGIPGYPAVRLFGVLGVAGLSAATVQAGLKAAAQGLLTRLRQDAYTDLVAVAIAQAPDKPGARRPRKVVAQEVRKRTLTTTVGATAP